MHLRIQTTPFGPFTDIDLVAFKVARLKLQVGVSHPSCLSWVMYAPQHTFPLGIRNFVQLWDETATLDGLPQSATNPLFEGFIEEVSPGDDSNLVHCVAYDPTRKTSNEITVMSDPWLPGDVGTGTLPVEGLGTYPRLVFNALLDNDDDYAFERAHWLTVGEMIATILDDQYHPLYWANAAPGDGTSAGNSIAYLPTDLTPLSYVPQEKEVFESQPVREAFEKLLRYAPGWRMLWQPGSRKWRFWDLTAAPPVTLTLNDRNAADFILSLELHRSLEGRWTAIHFYGPETILPQVAQVSDGSLTDISDGPFLQGTIATCCEVRGKYRWQITDPDLRRVARLLPEPVLVQTGDYNVVSTRYPTLLAYWPLTDAGNAGWRVVNGWSLDAHNGIIDFGDTYVFRYNRKAEPSGLMYENPTDVRFIYGRPDNPIQVRYPETGYEGTAYTVANLQNELKLHDEMLAVGYEFNQPVTTTVRRDQYSTLARFIHDQRKDMIYVGGLVLEGLRYDYSHLDRRINLAGVDANNQPMTTGWENINAFLTDVEYDFENQLTTLTFSSDQAEQIGIDIADLKKRLGIKALRQVYWYQVGFNTIIRPRGLNEPGGFDQFTSVHELTYTIEQGVDYVDPETGISPETGQYYG